MLSLPETVIQLLEPFRQMVVMPRTWAKMQVLLIGSILTTGKRTVTAALRVMGLGQERQYAKYHQVLSRAMWSGLKVSLVLLCLLVRELWDKQSGEPLVIGIDETLERRAGKHIEGCGYFRDGVRSQGKRVVKTRGLRWVSLMLLQPIAWAQRVWALPFLTILAYSQDYYQRRGRRAKTLTDWARQLLMQVRRWLPHTPLVVVGDATYARGELFHLAQRSPHPFTLITRVRFDVALYALPPARIPGQSGRGRPRLLGQRLPKLHDLAHLPATDWQSQQLTWYDHQPRPVHLHSFLAVWSPDGDGVPPLTLRCVLVRTIDAHGTIHLHALLCSDLSLSAPLLLSYFMRRWQMETTFQLARSHLGLETQRQWSPKAIARTTPTLLGLFSFVTLIAHALLHHPHLATTFAPRSSPWYPKPLPTFADALALVRLHLWHALFFPVSFSHPDTVQIPRPLFERFQELIAYAA